MPAKGFKKQFCKNGHDTSILGKDKYGTCVQCRRERQRKDPTKDSRLKDICINGHSITIVGRNKFGMCNGCVAPVSSGIRPHKEKKQFCSNGHDVSVVGRNRFGGCNQCQINNGKRYREENPEKVLEQIKQWREEHKEEFIAYKKRWYTENLEWIKEWRKRYYEEHKEEIKESNERWRKAHPELVRAYDIKTETNRSLRVVAWTDWDEIKIIYKNCPNDKQVDHFIPLLGDLVSGLHVSWNMQYLTSRENWSKRNKIDLNDASEWYGKVLEKEGLK